ncbi:PIN domain-containing protein [Sulfuricella sp. T08]|uniref:PIN domain-containing protein n=1 Tax=Sulfuricella sp. T08 TaxID=1632857 RepID=UPI001ED9BEAA|nr:PIN domain-containing protein [Sulfuricella sp. T08]
MGGCLLISSLTGSKPMSGDRRFFDTNVVLYLLSADQAKADRAEELLAEGGIISVQVLNEFAAVASRKLGMSWPEIREVLDQVRAVSSVEPLLVETHERSLLVAERYGISLYDSLIVAAALLAGCSTLYSEDMQHGQIIEGQLTICNPFRASE